MYSICNSFGSYYIFVYNVTLISVILSEIHHFMSIFNPVLYVYIYVIFFVIHNSVRITIFIPIPFLWKDIVLYLLALFEDNIWGRAPMVYLFSWWIISHFKI